MLLQAEAWHPSRGSYPLRGDACARAGGGAFGVVGWWCWCGRVGLAVKVKSTGGRDDGLTFGSDCSWRS